MSEVIQVIEIVCARLYRLFIVTELGVVYFYKAILSADMGRNVPDSMLKLIISAERI